MTRDFWRAVAAQLNGGTPAFVALVAAHTRGSPGTTGARMLLRPDGSQLGTIGGGIMEQRLIAEAMAAFDAGKQAPQLQALRHQRRDPATIGPGESGLICAGRQHNITLLLHPERDRATLEQLAELEAEGGNGRLRIDAGGLHIDNTAPDLAAPAATLHTGDNWCYREQLLRRERVAIIGGGHCGRALSRTMASVGYHVTVFDKRAEVATFRDNADADRRVVVADYREAGATLTWPSLTDVVVMTTDFQSDIRGLLGCVGHGFRFLGVMGSAAKIRAIDSALAEAGVAAVERARVHAPIGLPMKSDTPEEIAISVTAQLLQLARERNQTDKHLTAQTEAPARP